MRYRALIATGFLALGSTASAQDDVDRLVAAMLGDTPIISDLQSLTDEVGGRVTGSAANEEAIEWALGRFRMAEVTATKESFEMPFQWQERGVSASISGDFNFSPDVVAKPSPPALNRWPGRWSMAAWEPRQTLNVSAQQPTVHGS